MPQSAKPGISWPNIKERYCDGKSVRSLAMQFDVSRQAIMKRAKKEGWQKPPVAQEAAGDTVEPSTPPVTAPVTTFPAKGGALQSSKDRYGLRTPDNKAIAIKLAGCGSTYSMMAAAIGMSSSGLKAWRDAEPDFAADILAALSKDSLAMMEGINGAVARGDARAAQWKLERGSLTKFELGGKEQGGGPTLNVVINVPRSAEELRAMEDARIIEGAPVTEVSHPESAQRISADPA